MTTRTQQLGHDLTADLLYDLADEDKNPVSPKAGSTPAQAAASIHRAEPDLAAPFVQTTVFLSPAGWHRPRVHFTSSGFTLAAGPINLRAGR